MTMRISREKVKRLRSEKGWSQDHLAELSNLSLRSIQRIEKGGKCHPESKMAVASAFGIDAVILDECEEPVIQDNDDQFLIRIENGTALPEIVGAACGYRFHHDDSQNEEEAYLTASALQVFHDWGEIWSKIEPQDRVNAAYEMGKIIVELNGMGHWVFGLRSEEECPGPIKGSWPIASIYNYAVIQPKNNQTRFILIGSLKSACK